MRIKFVVLSALIGCLTLLLGPLPGHTQFPDAAPRPVVPTDWINERFFRLDRDGDGDLSFDEMTENLKIEKNKWDVNGDGRIDLLEWREYIKVFIAHQRRSPPDPGNPARGAPRPPLRGGGPAWPPRPRGERNEAGASPHAGKLPSNLPTWFKEFDTVTDSQIALYEWKDKQRTVKDFQKYDRNEDGFITFAELIRSGHFTGQKAPRTVNSLRAGVGEYFYFEVTGTTSGNLWGTDIYTADSPIATAAVHAGVVQVGESRLVKVTILPGQRSYRGSVSNGVTTRDYGAYATSYRVEAAP